MRLLAARRLRLLVIQCSVVIVPGCAAAVGTSAATRSLGAPEWANAIVCFATVIVVACALHQMFGAAIARRADNLIHR